MKIFEKFFIVIIFISLFFVFSSKTFAADTTSPIPFSITSPANNSKITQYSFGWSASTDDTGLAAYDLYIDGSKEGTVDPTYLYLNFTGTLTEGPHTVYIVARDLAGNSTSTETITFYVDNGSPSILVYSDNVAIQ